ncbi:MAG TPA: ABC transporter substrate-binding protein [Candidatus Bathyarchaeia archaeon]|nr:ABC transporter substrate-binding protein [Candidatus Bathyarchaeia archaeon]
MKHVKIKIFFLMSIILSSGLLTKLYSGDSILAVNPNPFFTITLLGTYGSPAHPNRVILIAEELPKIGIEVETVLTGWAQITPRTWSYPGPYPIPTYAEGGFDLFFVGWSWGLDWDPTGLYDSPSITPNGDNFYQYSNPEMDWAINNYTTSFVIDDRIYWCKQIQAILYEDLPQTTIIYPLSLYPHATDFEGWDGLLWALDYQNMENWSIGTQTEFHYAAPVDFIDFNPYTYESTYDAQWLEQIYNGLVERDPLNGRAYSPKIASSISSTDGLTYEIELAPGVKWADGVPLNTSDIEFSYKLMIDPDFDHSSLAYWQLYLDNNSVKIISSTELEITFLREYVFQDNNLALDILPKHIWDSIAPEDMEVQAITWATSDPHKLMGSGPYYLEEYDGTNGVIHLTVNPYYDNWTGITPNLDDIYFEFYSNKEGALLALANGLVDMVDAQYLTQIDEVPAGVSYTLVDDPVVHEMAFNCLHPYLGTGEFCPISSPESGKNIRKAISHIIPREIIAEESYGINKPGVTGCPSTAIGFDETLKPYEYNITLAKQYMEKAGFEFTYPTITPSPLSTPNPILEIQIGFYIGIVFFVFNFSIIVYLRKKKL